MKIVIAVLTIVLSIGILVTSSVSNPSFSLKLGDNFEDELSERCKILQDSVADLEKKAEILNRYLNMKHIEYMEVCDLVYKSKK